MSRIISVGTAVPPYRFRQSELKMFAQALLSGNGYEPGRMLEVFDTTEIDSRGFVHPREWFDSGKSFSELSGCYLSGALTLSRSAVKDCLNGYGGATGDFDHIIYVTSTGVSAPTIDALLLNELKLDVHLKRTPIWGLGCAGGAAGLSRALEYTRANPKSAALLIATEICSLAFHRDDHSKSNMVSLALFSDGAAAVPPPPVPGVEVADGTLPPPPPPPPLDGANTVTSTVAGALKVCPSVTWKLKPSCPVKPGPGV